MDEMTEAELAEAFGRLVRSIWVDYCREIGDDKPSHLAAWSDLSERDREVDRRIGLRLAQEGARLAAIEAGERENRLHNTVDRLERENAALREKSRFVLAQVPDDTAIRMDTMTGKTWRYAYGAWLIVHEEEETPSSDEPESEASQ